MICVSELATNAIAHTASGRGGLFTVEVDCPREGVARIAVTDAGGAFPRPDALPVPGEIMAEGGRGLAMVAACTSRWGYADAPCGPGHTVWAEACWPVGIPSAGSAPFRRTPPGPCLGVRRGPAGPSQSR